MGKITHPHLPRLEKTLASLRSEVLMRPFPGMGGGIGGDWKWIFGSRGLVGQNFEVNKEKHVPHQFRWKVYMI